jgi:hypothetical protein
MAKINLPTKPIPAVVKTPKRMILFSKPKVGKTLITSKLPKCLILDFEEGTLAIDAMRVQIKKFSDIDDVCQAIKEANYPYQFIAADTVSALEELCLVEAERRWASSEEGSNWFMRDPNDPDKYHKHSGKMQLGSIYNLPWGKGYQLVADTFLEVITKLEKHAPKLILLAHSTYATLQKNGVEFTSLDIQLGKKSKFNATFKADAIGYMYREGTQNYINFSAAEDVGAGGRHRYLEKEHILISEYIKEENSDEKFITYWEKIFAPKGINKAPKEKSSK